MVQLRVRHDIPVCQDRQGYFSSVAEDQVEDAHTWGQYAQAVVINHLRTRTVQREVGASDIGDAGGDV